MDSTDETIIALSKAKLGLLVLGSCAFVAAGAWMLSLDAARVSSGRSFASFFNNVWLVRGLGLAAVVFFGLAGLFGVKKLFDRKPGLVLNASGVVDNASGVAAGFIPWSEIVGASVFQVHDNKMLIIHVADSRKYTDRGGALRRAFNRAGVKMSGGPISIPSSTLQISFPELISLFERYRQKYAGGPRRADAPHAALDQSPHTFEALGGPAAAAPDAQLLNWSPLAIRGTLGGGGIGILVLSLSSLDLLFKIQPPLWASFIVALLPALIFFVATPDLLPDRVLRPAHWFAVVWYLVLSVLSISLATFRGLAGVDLLLAGFILLGAWPCLLAVRKLRAA